MVVGAAAVAAAAAPKGTRLAAQAAGGTLVTRIIPPLGLGVPRPPCTLASNSCVILSVPKRVHRAPRRNQRSRATTVQNLAAGRLSGHESAPAWSRTQTPSGAVQSANSARGTPPTEEAGREGRQQPQKRWNTSTTSTSRPPGPTAAARVPGPTTTNNTPPTITQTTATPRRRGRRARTSRARPARPRSSTR